MFNERESGQFELTPELASLERQLAEWTPAAPRVDRDRLMFAAGQAAARAPSREQGKVAPVSPASIPRVAGLTRLRYWQAATATMTAATILLAALVARQWERPAKHITSLAAKPQAAAGIRDDTITTPRADTWLGQSRPMTGYLGVRYVVLTRGLGALDLNFGSTTGELDLSNGSPRLRPTTARDLLEEFVPRTKQSSQTRS